MWTIWKTNRMIRVVATSKSDLRIFVRTYIYVDGSYSIFSRVIKIVGSSWCRLNYNLSELIEQKKGARIILEMSEIFRDILLFWISIAYSVIFFLWNCSVKSNLIRRENVSFTKKICSHHIFQYHLWTGSTKQGKDLLRSKMIYFASFDLNSEFRIHGKVQKYRIVHHFMEWYPILEHISATIFF